MRALFSYVVTSLDGYYEGPHGEFDWANVDAEYFQFANQSNSHIDTLLFGRAGYEHMAEYWPNATGPDAEVVEFMNTTPKIVFSSTLERADWNNTTLVRSAALADTVQQLKQRPGKEIALFGSVTLTASLLDLGLIDEVRLVITPLLLGSGRSVFSTLRTRQPLELWRTTTFRSGNVQLTYRPVRS